MPQSNEAEVKLQEPAHQPKHEATIASWWYRKTYEPRLKPWFREKVFEKYAGLKGAEIDKCIYDTRDRAWALRKYPCIGQFQFLVSRIPHFQCYPSLVERAKAGASVLDLGCCFGQDLRTLAADGAPTDNMFASDIDSEFWEMSFDLFQDKNKMHARFLQADILEEHSALQQELHGRTDIVIASHFYHLFTWDGHMTAFKNSVRISRPGTQIVGYSIGRRNGFAGELLVGDSAMTGPTGHNPYHHSPNTWKEAWQRVGAETGTQWQVEVWNQSLDEWELEDEDFSWMGPHAIGLLYVMTRTDHGKSAVAA